MRVTDLDRDRFTCGDCHVLADEISKLTGWDFQTFMDPYWGVDLHAFVRAPSGLYVDINGWQTERQLRDYWKGRASGLEIVSADFADVFEQWSESAYVFGPYSRQRARKLAPWLVRQA